MKKELLRWSATVGLIVLVLVVLALAVVFAGSQFRINHRYPPHPEQLATASPELIADAPRKARLYGCVSCHGEGLRGKLLADIPRVAHLHAPNLTLAASRATDQQLAQAIRQGIGPDGRGLWMMPAVPRLSDQETSALISWMRSLPVSEGEAEGVTFGPIGRVAILTGKLVPIAAIPEEQRTQLPVDVGDAHAEGRRMASLVCAICHGPALLGQPTQEGAVAPDLAIVAAYSLDQFRTLLRTGKGLGGRELPEMSDVARDALSVLTESEIEELHSYLVARSHRLRP